MTALGRFVVAARWWVIAAWTVLAVAGVFAAPRATSALSYDFSLPGQPGSGANQQILARYGSGGDNAPVLVVTSQRPGRALSPAAQEITETVTRAVPGARVDSFATDRALRSADGRTGVIVVYPRAASGPDAYPQALPALQQAAGQASRQVQLPVMVTGQDALTSGSGGGSIGQTSVIGIVIGAVIVIGGVCIYIFRDAGRRSAKDRRGADSRALSGQARVPGSKREKPRKLSAQEKKRRKRGRAPRRK